MKGFCKWLQLKNLFLRGGSGPGHCKDSLDNKGLFGSQRSALGAHGIPWSHMGAHEVLRVHEIASIDEIDRLDRQIRCL